VASGGSVAEIPINFVERTHGQSKMSVAIAVEAVFRITWWALLRIIGR
jgi:dolichol-phosphate mannosyltransferase